MAAADPEKLSQTIRQSISFHFVVIKLIHDKKWDSKRNYWTLASSMYKNNPSSIGNRLLHSKQSGTTVSQIDYTIDTDAAKDSLKPDNVHDQEPAVFRNFCHKYSVKNYPFVLRDLQKCFNGHDMNLRRLKFLYNQIEDIIIESVDE